MTRGPFFIVFALFSSICYIQSVDIADPWLVGVLSVTALIVRYRALFGCYRGGVITRGNERYGKHGYSYAATGYRAEARKTI